MFNPFFHKHKIKADDMVSEEISEDLIIINLQEQEKIENSEEKEEETFIEVSCLSSKSKRIEGKTR